MATTNSIYPQLEPLAKGLFVVVVAPFIAPHIAAGAWDSISVIMKGSKARRVTKSTISKALVESISAWALPEGISDQALCEGIEAATSAVERQGSALFEVLDANFDGATIARRIVASSRTELLSLSEAGSSVFERVLVEYYTMVVDPDNAEAMGLDVATGRANYFLSRTILAEQRDTRAERDERHNAATELLATSARRSSDHEVETRTNALRGRSQLVEPKIMPVANELLQYDWGHEVERRLSTVESFSILNPTLSWMARDISDVNRNSTFETLRASISRLDFTSFVRDAFHENIDIVESRPSTIAAIRWLETQSSRPQYRWLLPVLGAWGSGKSRVLHSLALEARARGHHVIFLATDPSRSIVQSLLRQISDQWDRKFRSTVEVERALAKELDSTLLVIFDDLEELVRVRPAAIAEIRAAIGKTTFAKHIRWAVALDSGRYDLLSEDSARSFWSEYGIASGADGETTLGGWWNLDMSNISQRLGLTLLRSNAKEIESPVLDRISEDATGFRFAGRFYCDPLPAWLQVESARDGLGELNNASALHLYWEQKLKAIEMGNNVTLVHLQRTVRAIAAEFASSGNPSTTSTFVVARALENNSRFRPASSAEIELSIELLRDAGLISLDWDTGEVSSIADIVWAYQIAEQWGFGKQEHPEADRIVELLSPWQYRSDGGDWLAEAVVQFAIQQLTRHANQELRHQFWSSWYISSSLSNTPLWSAALMLGSIAQSELVAMIANLPPQLASDHELYLFMRFLALADDSVMAGELRMRAVQPHFPAIGRAQLGSYLLFLVRRALATTELIHGTNVLNLMNGFVGIEHTGVLSEATLLLVKAGEATYLSESAGERWLFRVGNFLSRKNATPQRHPDRGRQDLHAGDRHAPGTFIPAYFWEELVKLTFSRLVERKGLSAFADLKVSNMLFDMDYTYMNSHVAKILRSTINISLGHSYSHGRGDSDEFVSLLEELLAGSACGAKRSEQQEWAFFILRHTERTADGNSIVVEDELKYWLMEMSTIPSLWKKWHKLMRPMLLANGLRLP